MNQRSLLVTQLLRLTLGRHLSRFFLIVGDLCGAFFIAWFIRDQLSLIPANSHFLQIWLIAISVIWLITYDIDKNYRLDAYLVYARVLKIAWWGAVFYLLFFVITREFYSLRFLGLVTVSWTFYALLIRWLLRRYSPPMRGLALTRLPPVLRDCNKILWQIIDNPKQVNFAHHDLLLIDFTKQYSAECQELLTHAHVVGLPILSVPQMIEHLSGKISIEHFNNDWVEKTFYINPFYLRLKRIIDVLITILLLPILLFLGLMIASTILVFMGRPIFYWQSRVGFNDKSFNMVKFRTMIVNAENIGASSTLKEDVRITRLGSWLRKLRLDELPQFYNVLMGEMSIIGPRPEHALLVEDYIKNIPLFQIRHWLRPGITGWAQVMQGYASGQDETMEKLRYDMFYLKNMSFWLDLIIVFKTVLTIITGFGSR